ncbi:MAG: MerR family transcriptional regulator [Actinobacteria bacterium]|nr:MerR family transcriptional regulator [Actinomycetota bacterium]
MDENALVNSGVLPIGAFSRACSISVRTLRNYHESGLLVPDSVDARTGYRCYSVDQLADALVIVRLRALDLPLTDVQRVLRARDPDVTSVILRQHEHRMLSRLEEVERIVGELQFGLAAASTPVHLVDTGPLLVVETRLVAPSAELWSWIERAAERLRSLAGDRRAAGEPIGALYTAALDDEMIEDVTVFVAVDEPVLIEVEDCRIGEIPAQTWASLVHSDGFDTIGDTYRILGSWVGRHASPRDTPILERYPLLRQEANHRNTSSDAIVELRWPIEPSTTYDAVSA